MFQIVSIAVLLAALMSGSIIMVGFIIGLLSLSFLIGKASDRFQKPIRRPRPSAEPVGDMRELSAETRHLVNHLLRKTTKKIRKVNKRLSK